MRLVHPGHQYCKFATLWGVVVEGGLDRYAPLTTNDPPCFLIRSHQTVVNSHPPVGDPCLSNFLQWIFRGVILYYSFQLGSCLGYMEERNRPLLYGNQSPRWNY